MSAVDLEALAALEKAATPGPWSEDDGNVFSEPIAYIRESAVVACVEGNSVPVPTDYGLVASTGQTRDSSDCDAALIPAMRNALPAILAELRAARALRAAIGNHQLAVIGGLNAGSLGRQLSVAIHTYDEAIK